MEAWLIPWDKDILDKLIAPLLVKKFSAFVELECSLLCSQEPATGPCLLPHEFSTHLYTHIFQVVSSLQVYLLHVLHGAWYYFKSW